MARAGGRFARSKPRYRLALTMQYAAENDGLPTRSQVRVVRGQRLALRARLARDHRMAQHHVAPAAAVGKRQNVGGFSLLAEGCVQPAAFPFTNYS